MHHEFWHERWQRNQIGFHQDQVNLYLRHFWPAAGMPAAGRVFVPLCGKSRDMAWLRQQGYEVVGVEISEIAVRDFFAELELVPAQRESGPFLCYEAAGYMLLCGDFFALEAADLGVVTAVYDRASLIALPPDMRRRYAMQMRKLVPAGVRTLLVAFEYPQREMDGPPFSVAEQEVAELYADANEIALLCDEDILEREPRFRDKGVGRLHEKVYLLTRK
ncbi:MAG TPA: thiopurine S-methyltransferase [Novimethylophilus sp.]|jgi:thiopurine S-methyltransferase|uniref:thiopurine S-methyltransferase n=1 Tax=Novimethylophilus sp. TaxID=2137426 RepID=UPI002F41E712